MDLAIYNVLFPVVAGHRTAIISRLITRRSAKIASGNRGCDKPPWPTIRGGYVDTVVAIRRMSTQREGRGWKSKKRSREARTSMDVGSVELSEGVRTV
jgi:hypothetical protein